MCKFTLGDAEGVSKINTQIAQVTVAANSLAVPNRLHLHEYMTSITRLYFLIYFAKRNKPETEQTINAYFHWNEQKRWR